MRVLLLSDCSGGPSPPRPSPVASSHRPRGGPRRRVAARHAIAGEAYVAGLAPGSRQAQAQALVRIARLLGSDDPRAVAWWKLTPEVVDAIRAQLVQQGANL